MSDDYFDFIVWYADDGTTHGFQLCYDKSGDERAINWTREGKLTHYIVDSGEEKPTANRTPVLRPGGAFDRERVRTEFLERSQEIDPEIRDLVLAMLTGCLAASNPVENSDNQAAKPPASKTYAS
jgi:hypothetical protein